MQGTTCKKLYEIELIHVPSVLNGATAKGVELKLLQIQLNNTTIKRYNTAIHICKIIISQILKICPDNTTAYYLDICMVHCV